MASVVIATRSRTEELGHLLCSLEVQTVPVEIHVMDDGSDDATALLISRDFPSVFYHRVAANRGPSFQRNRGIEFARCNIVFAVDDDTAFPSRLTVEQTVQEFDHPRVGAVGIPFINVRKDLQIRQRAPSPAEIYAVHAYVGAAHALRRDIFVSLGGYREHFFYNGEEGEYCLRQLNAGYLTRLGRADPIHHFESPLRDASLQNRLGRRNDILFAWHNVPMPWLPIHMAGTAVNSAIGGFVAGNPWLNIKGTINGLALCARGLGERNPVPASVYKLHRRLKKKGPAVLSAIEHLMPSAHEPSKPIPQIA